MNDTLTLGVYNIHKFTCDGRRHVFGPAVHYIFSRTPTPPDTFAFPECTHALIEGQGPSREWVNLLSGMLPGEQRYETYLARSMERENHHCCLQRDTVLNEFGFLDYGQLAGDPTATTNSDGSSLRIDRILQSAECPFALRDYTVFREDETRQHTTSARISDHEYVYATISRAPS